MGRSSTSFKPGNPGKPKGAKDTKPRVTKTLKMMAMEALDNVGREEWFEKQAKENPTAFMNFLSKYVPTEIKAELTGPGGGAIQVLTSVPESDLSREPEAEEVDDLGTYDIKEQF
jgi:hypothetical protein